MKSLTLKILTLVLSLFAIITVISQLFLNFKDKSKYEQALMYTFEDSVDFKGVFVRNEKVIPYSGNGILSYVNPDGSKIAKDSVIAEVYSSKEQVDNILEIDLLKNQVSLINKISNPGSLSSVQAEHVSVQIKEKYALINELIQTKDYNEINNIKNDLITLQSIYNILTNFEKTKVFTDKIHQLNNDIITLQSSKTSPNETIKTDSSGYFINYTDGFEEKLDFKKINSLSKEEINNIINTDSQTNNSAGKVISGYDWKIVGIINTKNNINSKVNIKILKTNDIVSATVEKLEPIDDNNYKIILSCDESNLNLLQERVSDISIINQKYKGIKVPRNAIRFENSERGVYVAYGEKILFRKLDVIYEGEDFVLSNNNSQKGFLALYDKIIYEEDEEFGNSKDK